MTIWNKENTSNIFVYLNFYYIELKAAHFTELKLHMRQSTQLPR